MNRKNKSFKKQLWGYNNGEVNRYISRLIDEYNNVVEKNETIENKLKKFIKLNSVLTEKLTKLESDLAVLQEEAHANSKTDTLAQSVRVEAIGQVMVDAEVYAVNKTAAADTKAEQIVRKARMEAEQTRLQAEEEIKNAYAKRDEIIESLHRTLGSISPENQPIGQKSVDFSAHMKRRDNNDCSDTNYRISSALSNS